MGGHDINRKDREFRRVKNVIRSVPRELCKLLVFDEDEQMHVQQKCLNLDLKPVASYSNLLQCITGLSFRDHRKVSTMCQCIIAKSMKRDEAKQVLTDALEQISTAEQAKIDLIVKLWAKLSLHHFGGLTIYYLMVRDCQSMIIAFVSMQTKFLQQCSSCKILCN